jgi:hypothetical protein
MWIMQEGTYTTAVQRISGLCSLQYPFYLASGRLVGELPLSLDTLCMLRPPSSCAISPAPGRLIESHLTLSHARPSVAATIIAPHWLCIPWYPRLFKIAEEVITLPPTRDPFFPDGLSRERGRTSKLQGGGVSVNTPTWLHTMRGGIKAALRSSATTSPHQVDVTGCTQQTPCTLRYTTTKAPWTHNMATCLSPTPQCRQSRIGCGNAPCQILSPVIYVKYDNELRQFFTFSSEDYIHPFAGCHPLHRFLHGLTLFSRLNRLSSTTCQSINNPVTTIS